MDRKKTKHKSLLRNRQFLLSLTALCVLMVSILGLNVLIIRRTENSRTMAEGQMQLTNIAAEVEGNLYQAECIEEGFASRAEPMVRGGSVDKEQLRQFVKEMTGYVSEKTQGIGFSVYIAYKDELYIEGFEPDENYILTEREWYKGAKKQQGKIHITSPYIDANTGKMCYSVSKLLSDGETIVGIDYSMDRIQSYIEEMGKENGGICMIVNDEGTVIGHSDPSGVGAEYSRLPHADIVRKVFLLYGDSFVYQSDGEKYNVFSSRTSYGWYLIVCVDSKLVAAMISGEFTWIIFFISLLALSIIVYYVYTYRSKERSDRNISDKEEALKSLKDEWERYSFSVTNLSRIACSSGLDSDESAEHIFALTERMSGVFDDIMNEAYSGKEDDAEEENIAYTANKSHSKSFMLIVTILAVASAAALAINTVTQLRTVDFRIRDEVKDYYYQIKEWAAENKTLVSTLSQTFSAKPDLIENYGECVAYLDDVVSGYEEVSVAYIVNPEWEHTVIMNNGWEPPDENWKVEERQWYLETLGSKNDNGFNISTPYFDEQTGYYCVTLSQIVYDTAGNRIGILGIDYYMDKLISILGKSYTEDGYAFLMDMNYNILNHPNEEYQMNADTSSNAGELAYRKAITTDKSVVIKDYDGTNRLCLAKEEELSGFSVILVKDWWYMYGSLLISDTVFVLLFGACIIIVIIIMSKTNRLEEQIHGELKAAAESAKAASRAKDDFLANMSHEIRTPMNAVVGMCELILRENDISDTVRDYCCNIRNSGKSLLSIINDILDFSKIESGKMELIEDDFNIASTIDDVINMAVARKGDKKLEIIVHTDADIPAGLVGDELRIRQIIINIVTNAIKYTPSGAVIISVSHNKTESGILLRVSVKDTGIGISEENLNKIFNSFQQVDTKKNRSVEGTGLGLAISQRLLAQMGGKVNVSSVYGEGSEFVVEIPLKVSDSTPFISVREPEKVFAAGYIDKSKYDLPLIGEEYERLISELGRTLRVSIKLFASFEELEKAAEEKSFSHIFIPSKEYLEHKAFIESEAESSNVVIIQDRNDPEELRDNMKCIYKPFYALSAAAVLNNERITAGFDEKKESGAGFTAPKARILIVDDNAVNLKVASGLMKPYNMQISTAESAEAAIEILRGKNTDLVFMDHMMPVTDGIEATAMIRAMDGDYYRNLPIIALTANAVNGVRDMFIKAGLNDFMAKPIETAALDRMLKTWLPKDMLEYSDNRSVSAPASSASVSDNEDVLFDEKAGLANVGGDENDYKDILDTFVRTADEKTELIGDLFSKKEWKNYIIEVHALKSSAFAIGSKKLSELAKELELESKAGNYEPAEKKTAALLEMYCEAANKAKNYLDEKGYKAADEKTELAETDSEKVKELIGKILEACEILDDEEISAVCDEAAGYTLGGKPLGESFAAIKRAASDFDYDTAAEKANEILNSLR